MVRDVADMARQLARELGPLRRAVSRKTRNVDGLPDLPDNQVEVLRAVVADPGIGTATLAVRLQLARPTVSNLLAAMKRAGLVELTRPCEDGRLVEVRASQHARALLDRYDRASEQVVLGVLTQLNAEEREALRSALPVLARMNDVLRVAD